MSTDQIPERTLIRIPRETSLWIPFARTLLVWLCSAIVGYIFSLEVYEFLIGAVRGPEGFIPITPPNPESLGVMFLILAAIVGVFIAVVFGTWDFAEALGPPSNTALKLSRFALFTLAFCIGSLVGYRAINAEWTTTVTELYTKGGSTAGGLSSFSAEGYVTLATSKLMIYGLGGLLPVAIIVTLWRRHQEEPELI